MERDNLPKPKYRWNGNIKIYLKEEGIHVMN